MSIDNFMIIFFVAASERLTHVPAKARLGTRTVTKQVTFSKATTIEARARKGSVFSRLG